MTEVLAILKNKFVLESGAFIGSSSIVSCEYTSCVNSQTNLSVGDVTADAVSVEVRGSVDLIKPGEKLSYYQVENDEDNLIGIFYAEAPTVVNTTTFRFKAYDGKAKLEVDFSEWLNSNQDKFPLTLRSLVMFACEVAGVSMSDEEFNFDQLEVPAFYAQGVTARQIISWAAQIAGCFVKCNNSGEICFAWYKSVETSINKSLLIQGSLSKKSYCTDQIKRVQFKQETDDVGIIYPADTDGNLFSISQNGICALLDAVTLNTIAHALYDKLKGITYTPLGFRIARTSIVKSGDIISVIDGNGNIAKTYVMKVRLDSSGTEISSTGDKNYSDKAAVSSEQYKNIPGKILSLVKSIDGMRVENANTTGKVSSIELDVDGIRAKVSEQDANLDNVQEKVTQLIQNTDQISITVSRIEQDGVDKVRTSMGYTFDDEGLQISKDGEQIHNRLNHEGMLVSRGDEAMLQADKNGVLATDVKVRNYLIIGKHCRVEDYGKSGDSQRTAVFWIPEE